jgi:hypothetical protein
LRAAELLGEIFAKSEWRGTAGVRAVKLMEFLQKSRILNGVIKSVTEFIHEWDKEFGNIAAAIGAKVSRPIE